MKLLNIAIFALAVQLAAVAAHADDDITSKSVLEPSQEVPVPDLPDPTDPETGSKGLGNGIITFDSDFTKADVKVTFSNLSGDVTRLHLHCNIEGFNGPIIVGLVDLVGIEFDNSEIATLDSNTVTGTITDAEIAEGDPCLAVPGVEASITDLHSLAEAIDLGLIYFNLHTVAFPAGELRGQVNPLNR